MSKLSANSGDSDQIPHAAVFDLGLHCLAITLLGVSRLKQVNRNGLFFIRFVLKFTALVRMLEWDQN